MLASDEALSLVEALERDIGDIEQTMPAEEWRLDPYLRKDAPQKDAPQDVTLTW
ncbi:hypothetical protein A7A08_01405 [Methyloligella halotolerans]|uniref:Uncharacterized protein n=1 Tax=Methyloligella halotolerans TaxID=1177755 RepID=A0A1E2RYR4_9HYPH|nr:hypothetical protein [Methyloligella halotolerans]ODA67373.1 hypothetical protein A7A08_01405 [Methyloligella halotolerans]